MSAASATLLGLTPTQTLAAIDVSGGTTFDINAGPGVNVIRVPSILVRAASAYHYQVNVVNIHLDPATDSAIINLDGSLAVGNFASIVVDGDSSKVIINMSGKEGAKVSVGAESTVAPPILVPTGTVTGLFHANLGNVFANRVVLRAGNTTDELTCQ